MSSSSMSFNMPSPAALEPAAPAAIASDFAVAAAEWDRFVEAAAGGDLVQTTAWARFKRATGFEVAMAVARDGHRILGGAQIVMKRMGPFGAIGYVARGPLLAAPDREIMVRVLDELERAARRHRVRHLVVQPPRGGEAMTQLLATRNYAPSHLEVAPSATILIDLAPDIEAIVARMRPTRRRNIRQAIKRGAVVRFGDWGDIDTFQAIHAGTARRQGFDPLSRDYLRAQWEALRPSGSVALLLACHQDRPIAGLWLTAFGDTATFRINGWTGEHPELVANVACHWQAMQWAKQQGFRWYDLGGIDRRLVDQLREDELPQTDSDRNPVAFKAAFRGEPVLLPTASHYTFNAPLRWAVRSGLDRVGDHPTVRRMVNRLRNGR